MHDFLREAASGYAYVSIEFERGVYGTTENDGVGEDTKHNIPSKRQG